MLRDSSTFCGSRSSIWTLILILQNHSPTTILFTTCNTLTHAYAAYSGSSQKRGIDSDLRKADAGLLIEDQELDLLRSLSRYPEVVAQAARNYEPHQVAYFARELANDFHAYYNAHPFIATEEHLPAGPVVADRCDPSSDFERTPPAWGKRAPEHVTAMPGMSQNRIQARRSGATSSWPASGWLMLLIGIVIGALASAFYTGMRSGDPDRLGSGLKQLLEVPRVDVETPMLALPADRAPATRRVRFFYCVTGRASNPRNRRERGD